MNREYVTKQFQKYTSKYNIASSEIQLKIEHTYRVANLCDSIAKSVDELSKREENLCWLIGLLHDIGRFEQMKRYRTFLDANSVDHAELGADLLFKENLLDLFWSKPITHMSETKELEIIESAIRQHNKLRISDNIGKDKIVYCSIIRDADKIDIFRISQEIPYEVRMTKKASDNNMPARREVMDCVRAHKCVPRMKDGTEFESLIAGCAMAFELEFSRSIELVREQGYLRQMLEYEPKNGSQEKQMQELRKELAYIL